MAVQQALTCTYWSRALTWLLDFSSAHQGSDFVLLNNFVAYSILRMAGQTLKIIFENDLRVGFLKQEFKKQSKISIF